MKHNNHIDFFSSPSSKFIGFSDIRQPKEDINHHQEAHEESMEEEKKPQRKSSFGFMYEPIMPFDEDFFEEKLEECEEPEEYSEEQHQETSKEDDEIKSPFIPENLLNPRPNYPIFNESKKKTEEVFSDMFYDPDENKTFLQGKATPNFEDKFMTPKKKVEFLNSKRFAETTAEKSVSRSTEKGLRRLSTLAFSIVNSSSPTTYKEVAEKLLSRLNFDCTELDDEECRAERSSMQNVKRRVYDSLNVLIALGVINRSGNKITKQKEKKTFLSGHYSDLEKYNELLNEYNKKRINLEMKKNTERQLKEKFAIFKKTIERNKKTKLIAKNRLIRLPFLVFATKEQSNEDVTNKNVEWITKKNTEVGEKEKKKSTLKRTALQEQNENEKINDKLNEKMNDVMVKINLKEFPYSYGDLDFFKMIEEQNLMECSKLREIHHEEKEESEIMCEEYMSNSLEVYHHQGDFIQQNESMMNLIDEVLDYE